METHQRSFAHSLVRLYACTLVRLSARSGSLKKGTKYACFRVPSTVQALNGDIVIFVESRIASCNDQAPKDITMKVRLKSQADESG